MLVTAPFWCFKTPPYPSQMSILISERAYSLGCGENDGWTYFPCLPGLVLYMHSMAQSCLTLCGLRNCSPPGSTAHGIFQARILEWVAISSSRGSSKPRDWNFVSCVADGFFTCWAIREAWYIHISRHQVAHLTYIQLLFVSYTSVLGFPSASGKKPTCQCRRWKRTGFDPWKMPWRRKWQLTAIHGILVWRISWTEEPGGLLSMGSQRVWHDRHDITCMHIPQHSWKTTRKKRNLTLTTLMWVEHLIKKLNGKNETQQPANE